MDKVIKLNNEPAVVLAFVDMLRVKMEDAFYEGDDREWALSVVDDIKTMCHLVCDSIVEEEDPAEHKMVIPMPNFNGPKS